MKINDKKVLVKLLSYIVMGDGGVYQYGNKNAKFIMNMSTANLDYIEFCKSVIENITTCYLYERKDYNTDGYIRKPQIRLESRAHPEFTKLRNRIYTEKYKGIDPHALKMLDEQSLAILYMCDGSYSCKVRADIGGKNPSHNVTLNLKRLSYGDLYILKKALKEKLGQEWNINKQNSYYYLRLRAKDVNSFMSGVSKYVFPSFQYKIKKDFRVIDPNCIGW